MTHAPADFPASGEYFSQPDALGSFDGETDYDAPPMVYIARADGAALRAACQAGAVDATVNADIRVRLEEDGGFGYNVVGKIPGTVNPSQMVVVSSHHDAWFKGVMDDTSAIATALTMAKAMRTSGTRPTKTLVFLVTTGEEFGTTNSWYDWLIGAYHFIDKAHPDWVGRIAGQINLEWQGLKDAPFQVRANPEMAPYVQGVLDGNPALVPYGVDNGGKVRPNAWTWNDQWPFTAKGVPSVYFVAKDAAYRGQWYHTQYDDLS
jgi:Zn-dependent M28 family amino/carboxypeptidase